MKLEVGMYVRTKDGIIARIKEIDNNERLYLNQKSIYTDDYKHDLIIDYEVIKASYDIIDILEIGDYVNGYYVEDVLKTFVNVAVGSNYFQSPTIYEKDIKSIVTHEQMEQMAYKVGE